MPNPYRLYLSLFAAAALVAVSHPALARSAVTVGQAALLSGPDASYEALAQLASGARVDLVWCGLRDEWCLVDRHGKRGWIPLAELTLKTAGDVKPVATLKGGASTSGKPPAGPAAAPPQSATPEPGDSAIYAVHSNDDPEPTPSHPTISKGPTFSLKP